MKEDRCRKNEQPADSIRIRDQYMYISVERFSV